MWRLMRGELQLWQGTASRHREAMLCNLRRHFSTVVTPPGTQTKAGVRVKDFDGSPYLRSVVSLSRVQKSGYGACGAWLLLSLISMIMQCCPWPLHGRRSPCPRACCNIGSLARGRVAS